MIPAKHILIIALGFLLFFTDHTSWAIVYAPMATNSPYPYGVPPCTPNCNVKCGGASDGCTGTCNAVCLGGACSQNQDCQ